MKRILLNVALGLSVCAFLVADSDLGVVITVLLVLVVLILRITHPSPSEDEWEKQENKEPLNQFKEEDIYEDW